MPEYYVSIETESGDRAVTVEASSADKAADIAFDMFDDAISVFEVEETGGCDG